MHVRFLAPDVAMMHTRFHIYDDVDESERTSIGIRVVRKLDGRSAVLDAGDAFGFTTGQAKGAGASPTQGSGSPTAPSGPKAGGANPPR